MSLGRTSTFLDIYIERDIKAGVLEDEAQELLDQFIIKLRIVRFLRTPDYNDYSRATQFGVTESLGGQGMDGRTLVHALHSDICIHCYIILDLRQSQT